MVKRLTKKEEEKWMSGYRNNNPLKAQALGLFALMLVWGFALGMFIIICMVFIAMIAVTLKFWGVI